MATAKICGLSTAEAVEAALAGGASHVGFMFFPKSPRNIAPAAAAALADAARGRAQIVAVTVDATDEDLSAILPMLKPDLVQLHGQETPARAAEIADRVPVIKVLHVSEAADLDAAAAYEPIAAHLMFETKPPAGADRPGGNAVSFDWDILAGRGFQRPYLLAGGLNPGNASEAVRRSGAPILDVSSGVERAPGLKDPALIAAFLSAVRRA